MIYRDCWYIDKAADGFVIDHLEVDLGPIWVATKELAFSLIDNMEADALGYWIDDAISA